MEDVGTVGDQPRKYRRAEIFSVHRPFQLTDGDYLRLTKIPGFLPIWAHTIAAGAAIYALNLAALWVSSKINKVESPIATADWFFFSFLVVLVAGLQFLNWKVPSERKRTAEKIEQHFREQNAESIVMEKYE